MLFLFREYSPYKECCKGPDASDVYISMKPSMVHGSAQPFAGRLSPLGSASHSIYNQGLARNIPLESSTCSPVSPLSSQTASYNGYPQIQVSGTSGAGGVFYAGDFNTASAQSNGAMFPAAMSVNLSMNMTMGVPNFADHFTGTASSSVPTNHMQWTTTHLPSGSYGANGTSPMVSHYGQPVQVQYNPPPPPPLPTAGASGTYTFTAEFRPADSMSLPSMEREFPSCGSNLKAMAGSFYPYKHGSLPLDSGQDNFSVMLKSKPRSVPTGRAACFPAITNADSPPPPLLNPEPDGSNSPGKMNLCRICGKTYARPSTLKTHMRTHSGERPYRCATCDKSFSQAANLTAHARTHSGEKPFRCHVCDRRFSQSSSVTTHMRTHSGERPYRCYMCKKSFSDSSTLTKHVRIHSGEKPYKCNLCPLRFSQSGNLNRHMRVHSNSV
ncbi:protein glass [Caerostris darwini]|uniref:Protein glass n=1 Tax=Caerostris darwini TaxID=1538125 RepID=A0AAV4WIX6_9ARAC|nr:protein glass [Caerostris darwini]